MSERKYDKFTIVPRDMTLELLCFLKFVSIKEQIFNEDDAEVGDTITQIYFNVKKFANLTIPDLQKTTVAIVELYCGKNNVVEMSRKKINIFNDGVKIKCPGTPVVEIYPNYVTYLMYRCCVSKNENKIEFIKRKLRIYDHRPTYYNQYFFPEIFELVSNIFTKPIIFTLFSYLTIDKYF